MTNIFATRSRVARSIIKHRKELEPELPGVSAEAPPSHAQDEAQAPRQERGRCGMSDDEFIVRGQNELNAAFAQAPGRDAKRRAQQGQPAFQLPLCRPRVDPRGDAAGAHKTWALASGSFASSPTDDTKLMLVTRLAHKSGQNEDSRYPIALDRPQAMGSSLTYARRYNWAGMCGVGFEEDDDANEAERDKPPAKTKAKARESKD